MRKMCKQIFKGDATHMSNLMSFFLVFLKTTVYVCFSYFSRFQILILLSIFTFLYSTQYLGNINWEVLLLIKLGKLHLPRNI